MGSIFDLSVEIEPNQQSRCRYVYIIGYNVLYKEELKENATGQGEPSRGS